MHKSRWFAAVLATVFSAALVGTAAPAQAALPDAFGFVLWSGSPVPSGTQPAATTVTVLSPGIFLIRFPGEAAKYGVVHVTAVNDAPRWCQAIKWGMSGTDEVVEVSCYSTGGVLTTTPFSAFFESSSGPAGPINGRFGYADVNATGTLVTQYNSSGAVNSAGVITTGLTEVKIPLLSTPGPMDGSLQVTAVNTNAARCTIRNWTSSASLQDVYVMCYDATGAPLATRFTLTYQYQQSLYGAAFPPKYFGYLYNKPLGGPASTNWNSTLGSGANSVSNLALGVYQVVFPNLAVVPDNVQVTSANSGSSYCNLLTPWLHSGTTTVAKVACYTNAGARVNAGFTISTNSAF